MCSFPSLRFCLAPPPSASVSARCYLRCRCCFSPTRRRTGSSDIHIPSIGSMPCGSTTFGPTRQPPNGRGWTTEDLVRLPRPPHPSTQHLQPSLYPILSLISVIVGNPMTSLVASFLRPLPCILRAQGLPLSPQGRTHDARAHADMRQQSFFFDKASTWCKKNLSRFLSMVLWRQFPALSTDATTIVAHGYQCLW